MLAQFTIQDILAALRGVDLDKLNPMAGGAPGVKGDTTGCEYTVSKDGRTASCFVGTVLGRLDHELLGLIGNSGWAYGNIPNHVARNFTPEAFQFLQDAQKIADKREDTWREVLGRLGYCVRTVTTVNNVIESALTAPFGSTFESVFRVNPFPPFKQPSYLF